MFVSTKSTSSHEFASQFGLQHFFIREKHLTKTIARTTVYLNEAATGEKGVNSVTVGRHRPIEQRHPERRRWCVCVRACVRDVFAIYDNNI